MTTPFQYQHRVTYAECAPGNHVYHARYLDLLEAARGEFFRELGHPLQQLQEQGHIFLIIEARLRYLAPARYDDLLAIQVWPTFATGVRLNFAYTITLPSGKPCLEAETLQVCAGLNEKPARPPGELIAVLAPAVRPPPPKG
jgi:acyl-CoA thioester hydrolase